MKKIILIFCVFASVIAASSRADAQVNIFMKLVNLANTQIVGESVTKNYVNETAIISVGQNSTVCAPTAAGAVPQCAVTIGDFTVQMRVSKVSDSLFYYMFSGGHLKSVDLYYVTQGSTPVNYYTIHMENVYITKIAEVTTSTSTDNIQQQVSFFPQQVGWSYSAQNADGSFGTPIKFGWNRVTNAVWTF